MFRMDEFETHHSTIFLGESLPFRSAVQKSMTGPTGILNGRNIHSYKYKPSKENRCKNGGFD